MSIRLKAWNQKWLGLLEDDQPVALEDINHDFFEALREDYQQTDGQHPNLQDFVEYVGVTTDALGNKDTFDVLMDYTPNKLGIDPSEPEWSAGLLRTYGILLRLVIPKLELKYGPENLRFPAVLTLQSLMIDLVCYRLPEELAFLLTSTSIHLYLFNDFESQIRIFQSLIRGCPFISETPSVQTLTPLFGSINQSTGEFSGLKSPRMIELDFSYINAFLAIFNQGITLGNNYASRKMDYDNEEEEDTDEEDDAKIGFPNHSDEKKEITQIWNREVMLLDTDQVNNPVDIQNRIQVNTTNIYAFRALLTTAIESNSVLWVKGILEYLSRIDPIRDYSSHLMYISKTHSTFETLYPESHAPLIYLIAEHSSRAGYQAGDLAGSIISTYKEMGNLIYSRFHCYVLKNLRERTKPSVQELNKHVAPFQFSPKAGV